MVISFAASCIITTLASIAASILDQTAATEQPRLPRRWQPGNVSQLVRETCLFVRRILDRPILDFADQQLVTVFALLISAWMKLHTNAVLKSFDAETRNLYLRFPNLALPNAEFSLIVFLCMSETGADDPTHLFRYWSFSRSSGSLYSSLLRLLNFALMLVAIPRREFSCLLSITWQEKAR